MVFNDLELLGNKLLFANETELAYSSAAETIGIVKQWFNKNSLGPNEEHRN